MRDKENKKYLYYALTGISVILFWYLLQNIAKLKEITGTLLGGLTSVLIGMFIAYLLNPILVCLEKKVFIPFATSLVKNRKRMKNKEKFIFKFGRTLSIIWTLAIFIGLLWEFVGLIVPQVYSSILSISNDIPVYVENVQKWISGFWDNNAEQAAWLTNIINQVTKFITDYLNNDLIPKLGDLIVNISSGLIGGVKFIINFVIGIMVSVYIMAAKERFGAQLKKLLYAVLSRSHANKVLQGVREVDRIFGGFISGKLVDSLIIAVICYLGMLILKLPYEVLISVIIGVTNVIPFFGPIIGAIPCAIIVFFVSPMQCVVFVILILVLQQLDGNVIGPLILGDSIGISGFWIIVSISIGASTFGVAGMLLGVPVFACLYSLVRHLCNYMLQKKNLPMDTVEYMNIERIDREHHIVELEEHNLAEVAMEEELQEALEKKGQLPAENKPDDEELSDVSDAEETSDTSENDI